MAFSASRSAFLAGCVFARACFAFRTGLFTGLARLLVRVLARLFTVGRAIGLVSFTPRSSVSLLLRGIVIVLVHGGDESLIVFGVLEVALGGNPVTAGLGVPRE